MHEYVNDETGEILPADVAMAWLMGRCPHIAGIELRANGDLSVTNRIFSVASGRVELRAEPFRRRNVA